MNTFANGSRPDVPTIPKTSGCSLDNTRRSHDRQTEGESTRRSFNNEDKK